MAELLYVHLLMASDIKGSTKRRNISTVLSWSESPSEIPLDLDAALDHGFAHAGMGFRSKRPTQISFLIEFTRDWVGLSRDHRDELLEDPWEFKAFVYGIPSAGSPESQRNALLYLAHPDTFENIVSQYHKRDITEAFGELALGLADVDRALLAIRQQLDSEAGESVNFYEEPFVSRWQGAGEAEAEQLDEDTEAMRNAWLLRAGRKAEDQTQEWLDGGYCAIGWVEAESIEAGATRRQITSILEQAFPDQPKGWVRSSAGNIDRFLNQMHPGDLVVTPNGQDVYVGIVTSDPYLGEGTQPRRRSVDWANPDQPIQRSDLSESAYSKMRTLLTVSDISENLGEFARFADLDIKAELVPEVAATSGIGPVALDRVSDGLADELHLPAHWLNEIVDLLEEKRQVIFYGPPGTGKTFVAQQLADYLTEVDGSTLVQFHPSYAYEDFFEGFRPQESSDTAGVSFELVPGPLRRLADVAREDKARPYVLIIDEINRANLAKVFGELYFLLEYRDRSIALQYGAESDFSLPKNLFVIGTMNTADRSIAFVDAAMRRRFYFIPFFPRSHPIDDLLERWLLAHDMDRLPASLLRTLNDRIDDDDFAIGPSYFMTPRADSLEGLKRIWEHAILPLLEEHFFGTGRDVRGEFGIDAVLRAGNGGDTGAGADDADSTDHSDV